jgi:hypothetical protein
MVKYPEPQIKPTNKLDSFCKCVFLYDYISDGHWQISITLFIALQKKVKSSHAFVTREEKACLPKVYGPWEKSFWFWGLMLEVFSTLGMKKFWYPAHSKFVYFRRSNLKLATPQLQICQSHSRKSHYWKNSFCSRQQPFFDTSCRSNQ